jgi:hypothetical protein
MAARAAILGACLLWALPAHAYQVQDDLEVYGYFQAWLTAWEQGEVFRGLVQQPSGDRATGRTTGFSLNRARVGLDFRTPSDLIGVAFQLKLETPIEILDLFVRVKPIAGLTLQLGQFKIPSTAENLTDNRALDFILRSDISSALVDYSLSRTTYASSLFFGNNAYLRDFGVGLKLDLAPFGVPTRAFGMMSNGLGANLYIGGLTKKEFVLTNGAQFFYGLRLEVEPVPEWVSVGAVASYNRHDNIVFNSGRAVLDLNRRSAAADLTARLRGTGVQLGGLYGGGRILDDSDDNGRDDFRYRGWAAHALWELNPLAQLLFGSHSESHRVELGLRYEDYVTEADESGEPTHRRTTTLGLAYTYEQVLKAQLNMMLHHTRVPYLPDLRDDAVILSLQTAI